MVGDAQILTGKPVRLNPREHFTPLLRNMEVAQGKDTDQRIEVLVSRYSKSPGSLKKIFYDMAKDLRITVKIHDFVRGDENWLRVYVTKRA